MFSHAPPDYDCPFCAVVNGENNPLPFTQQSDVVLHTTHLTAFIAAKWWFNNPGHVLVIPNQHIENIYTLPSDIAIHIYDAARQIAIAFKDIYQCDGTSTRQHNEPAGSQDVWHYHLHVFPRYANDFLYEHTHLVRYPTPDERAEFADKLRSYLAKNYQPLDSSR